MSLEDEHGSTQVIVWRHIKEKQREVLLGSRLLAVKGRWQREGVRRCLNRNYCISIRSKKSGMAGDWTLRMREIDLLLECHVQRD